MPTQVRVDWPTKGGFVEYESEDSIDGITDMYVAALGTELGCIDVNSNDGTKYIIPCKILKQAVVCLCDADGDNS